MINALINCFRDLKSIAVFKKFKSFKTGLYLHYIWKLQLYLGGTRVRAQSKDQSANVV